MFFSRRKHEREKVTDCTFECSSEDWSCNGYVVNLSDGGMKVDLEDVPVMNREIEIFMACESGKKLNKRAVVAWFIEKTKPETGAVAGLKFI